MTAPTLRVSSLRQTANSITLLDIEHLTIPAASTAVLDPTGAGTSALLRLLAPLGDGIFWLRTPSLVCGTLAIPVVYAAGRRLAGPVAGGIAAALLAFSPAAISMSQVARPYGLQLLLVSGVIATWLRAIDRRRARDLWVYSALATAALLAHYGSLIAIAATLAGFAAERVRTGAFSFPARDLAKAQLPVFAVLALLRSPCSTCAFTICTIATSEARAIAINAGSIPRPRAVRSAP